MSQKYQIDMTTGAIWKKILFFALPLMASSVLQLLYNAADIIVIGNFRSSVALSAITSTSSLISLIVNLFIGLSVGTNVLVAKYYASKDPENCEKIVHTSILVSIVSGTILGLGGFILARKFLIWMDSPANVIDLATDYLKIYFIGMPANLCFNFGSAILRGVGDTKRPLIYLTISGIINVGANLLFVLAFNMSTDGVAWATIISQYISAILVMSTLMKELEYVHFDFRQMRIDWKSLGLIAKIGLPAGLQGILFSISNVIIQSSVNFFGSYVMAGNGAASNIEGFVYVIMNSFYQAAISFTAQNIGAKKSYNIPRILKYCQYYVVIFGAVFGIGAYLLSPYLLKIYTQDSDVISIGMLRMAILCAPYFLCGMMDVMVGSLRGMGYSTIPMITALLGVCVFRIVWIFTIFRIDMNLGLLYATYPMSWILSGSAHYICFLIIYNKRFKNRDKLVSLTQN